MAYSSDVSSGDVILASQYNNLRKDVVYGQWMIIYSKATITTYELIVDTSKLYRIKVNGATFIELLDNSDVPLFLKQFCIYTSTSDSSVLNEFDSGKDYITMETGLAEILIDTPAEIIRSNSSKIGTNRATSRIINNICSFSKANLTKIKITGGTNLIIEELGDFLN